MPRKQLHQVSLTETEQKLLQRMISTGREKARDITRARILLKTDRTGSAWNDNIIAQALDVSVRTIQRVRKQFCQEGIKQTIRRKTHEITHSRAKFDAEKEAKVIAILQSEPPHGRIKWTVRLLTSRLIELQVFEQISRETVRKHLKKCNLSRGSRKHG